MASGVGFAAARFAVLSSQAKNPLILIYRGKDRRRPCLFAHPAKTAPAGTPRSGAAHLCSAAFPGAFRPKRTTPAGRNADACPLPRLWERREGTRSLVAEHSGRIRRQIDLREEDEVGRFQAEYQAHVDRLGALDTEIAVAWAKRDAAKTRGDKAAAETVIAKLCHLAALELANPLASKYPPAEPGALVSEPLEAAYPCRFSSAALFR